jgi:hypothetical protein
MKIQALMIPVAVAVAFAAGSAFAATPGDTASTAAAADTAKTATTVTKKSHKKTAKKKQATPHAGMQGTQAMGAGAASPVTDLEAPSRQSRIDQAYANWQAQAR